MAFVVLGLFVMAAIVLSLALREGGWLTLIAGGLIAAMVVGLVIDGPVNWIMREKIDLSYDLASINDGRKTQGSFFLGSGTIDSVPSFMYYAEDRDGFLLRDWPAYASRVVETNDKPRVVYTCDDYNSVPPPFRWTAKFALETSDGIDCDYAFVTFYVPENSIKSNYILDAE